MLHVATFAAIVAVIGLGDPALALPVQTLNVDALGALGAIIQVRKGKGHGDRDERYEHRRGHHGRHHHTERQHGGFGGNLNQPNGQN